jgi:hypothetical protein
VHTTGDFILELLSLMESSIIDKKVNFYLVLW